MKKKEQPINPDLHFEGKKETYLDIDRMINEGLAGGTVHRGEVDSNIEEARDLIEEEPPHTVDE